MADDNSVLGLLDFSSESGPSDLPNDEQRIASVARIIEASNGRIAATIESDVTPLLREIEAHLAAMLKGNGLSSPTAGNIKRGPVARASAIFPGSRAGRRPGVTIEQARTPTNAGAAAHRPAVAAPVSGVVDQKTPSNIVVDQKTPLDDPQSSQLAPARERGPKGRFAKKEPVESASKSAVEDQRRKREDKEQRKGLSNIFKGALGDWNGEIMSDAGGGEIGDAVGTATAGPIWGAVSELRQMSGGLLSIADDEDSLAGILKKRVQDVAGITRVKEGATSLRERASDSLRARFSGDQAQTPRRPGAQRDRRGRYLTGPERALANAQEEAKKEQVEAVTGVQDSIESADKESGRRHEELVSTIADAATEPLADSLLNGFIEGKSQGMFSRKGRRGGAAEGGKKGGLLSRFRKGGGAEASPLGGKRSRLGKFGRFGGKLLGGVGALGAGALTLATGGVGGLLDSFLPGGGGDSVESTVASTVAERGVSKAASLGGSAATAGAGAAGAGAAGAGKLGMKGVMKGALGIGGKALRVLGPLAAIATAGYDSYQGWNDKEMQSKAFDLKEGEEASTGQKTASSVANVMDMGGLVSGGLSMLGMDVGTEDIAKGLYDAVSSVGGLFGMGDEDKDAEATVDKKQPKAPESVDEITRKAEAQGEDKSGASRKDELAKEIRRLSEVLDGMNGKDSKNISAGDAPRIGMDFEDSSLALMAHDRL